MPTLTLKDVNVRQVIGLRIRHLREESGRSVAALCEQVGIAKGYWYEIERGEVNVTIDTVAQIAGALKVTVRDLLESNGRKKRDLVQKK